MKAREASLSDTLVFGLIMFFAAFTKGFAGFGQALVGVPLLAGIIGSLTMRFIGRDRKGTG